MRLQGYAVSAEVVARLLASRSIFQLVDGPPEGAKFHSSWYVDEKRVLMLIYEHPVFDEVREGEIIPAVGIGLGVVEKLPDEKWVAV